MILDKTEEFVKGSFSTSNLDNFVTFYEIITF